MYDRMCQLLKPDGEYAAVDAHVELAIEAAGYWSEWESCQAVQPGDTNAAIDRFLRLILNREELVAC